MKKNLSKTAGWRAESWSLETGFRKNQNFGKNKRLRWDFLGVSPYTWDCRGLKIAKFHL